MEEEVTATVTADATVVPLLNAKEKEELDSLMQSYNDKIMDRLMGYFNRRQKYTKRLTQLFLQYKVEKGGADLVFVRIYLTTQDKLLLHDISLVKEGEVFNTKQVRSDLTFFMVKIMKHGLSALIRKSKNLPPELI